MGMASSQARLLSLTSRQLDTEWRSQVLQARKLQLANDSRRVYNNYLESLNESKIQYRYTNSKGEAVMRDATLNGLQNGLVGAQGASDLPMFLQSIDGKTLFVTPGVNSKYNLTGVSNGAYSHLNAYLEDVMGSEFTKVVKMGEPVFNVGSLFAAMGVTNDHVPPATTLKNEFKFTSMITQATNLDETLDAIDAFYMGNTYTNNSMESYCELIKSQTTEVIWKNNDFLQTGSYEVIENSVKTKNANSIVLNDGTQIDDIKYVYINPTDPATKEGGAFYAISEGSKVAYKVDLDCDPLSVVSSSAAYFVADDQKAIMDELLSKNLILKSESEFSNFFLNNSEYANIFNSAGLQLTGDIYFYSSRSIMYQASNPERGDYFYLEDLIKESQNNLNGKKMLYAKFFEEAVNACNARFVVTHNEMGQMSYKPKKPEGEYLVSVDEDTYNRFDELNFKNFNGINKENPMLDQGFVPIINPAIINENGIITSPGFNGARYDSYMCSSDAVANNIYGTLSFYKANNPSVDWSVPGIDKIQEFLHGSEGQNAVADLNASIILYRLNQACEKYLHSLNIEGLSENLTAQDDNTIFGSESVFNYDKERCKAHNLGYYSFTANSTNDYTSNNIKEVKEKYGLSIEYNNDAKVWQIDTSEASKDYSYEFKNAEQIQSYLYVYSNAELKEFETSERYNIANYSNNAGKPDYEKYFSELVADINDATDIDNYNDSNTATYDSKGNVVKADIDSIVSDGEGLLGACPPPSTVPPIINSNDISIYFNDGDQSGKHIIMPTHKNEQVLTQSNIVGSEDPSYIIPDDYALANNIYMTLVKYCQKSDEALSYANVDLYKEIYNKVEELGTGVTSQKIQIQKALESYSYLVQNNIEPSDALNKDMETLYNYFIPTNNSRVSKYFVLTSETFPVLKTEDYEYTTGTKHEDDLQINNAISTGNIAAIAQSYFNYYSNKGFCTVQETEIIDTSNPSVQKAIAMYNLGQQYKINVVSDEIASSKDYVTNMIQNAAGVLLTVDTSKVAATEYTYVSNDSTWTNPVAGKENSLKQVSEKMTNLVEVCDVNIASSTYLDEISNAKKVAEAQATYESAMATINKKETRIDNQLNQLEAERAAIKTEQDSVKNVVKENVDLAFKLFS